MQIDAHIGGLGIITDTKIQHFGPAMLFLSLSVGLVGPGGAFSFGVRIELGLKVPHSPLLFHSPHPFHDSLHHPVT